MKTSQIKLLNLKPEFCEYSEPFETYFRCRLTGFGFVWRCTNEDRAKCPDLEYFQKRKLEVQK